MAYHHKTSQQQRQYALVDRPPANSCLSKLCYRFVNTHRSIVTADGTFFTEIINANPAYFFQHNKGVSQVFDFDEMRRWLAHLHDVDENGLPKEMVKEEWDKRWIRGTPVQRDGLTYIELEFHSFLFDSATDDWSRLVQKNTCSWLWRPKGQNNGE
jgi:hypothetical protein